MAGVGWDANLLRFIRQQVQAQWCCALGGGTVLSLTGGVGLMLPWGPGWSVRQTCISDRCVTRSLHSFTSAECQRQLQAQWCCALGGGTVLSLTGGLGLVLPWGPDWSGRQTCFSDRCAPLASADPCCRIQADRLRYVSAPLSSSKDVTVMGLMLPWGLGWSGRQTCIRDRGGASASALSFICSVFVNRVWHTPFVVMQAANQLPVLTSTPSSGRVCCHKNCDFLSLKKSTVRQRWSQTPILHAGSSLEAWLVTCEASSSRGWGPAASGGQRRKTAPRYMPCSITTALCYLPTSMPLCPWCLRPMHEKFPEQGSPIHARRWDVSLVSRIAAFSCLLAAKC